MVHNMMTIKPVSELRNNFSGISEICHKEGEPVFLTKNGSGDLVVMSHALYEKNVALLDLYQKLSIAERQVADNVPCVPHEEVFSKLRERING